MRIARATFRKEIAMPKIQVLPRHVAELNDPSVAAIASAETAGLYGLQILSAGINADGDNTTRFIVIERAAAPAMTGDAVHGTP